MLGRGWDSQLGRALTCTSAGGLESGRGPRRGPELATCGLRPGPETWAENEGPMGARRGAGPRVGNGEHY